MEIAGRLHAKIFNWGSWWDRLNKIDVVALNSDTLYILFSECKWQKRKTDADAIKQQLDTASQVNWFNRDRKRAFYVYLKGWICKRTVEFAYDRGCCCLS